MLKKMTCLLVILSFFIGFVLIASSLARPWPGEPKAIEWTETCERVLPGSDEIPYENADDTISQDGFQIPVWNDNNSIERIEWSNFLLLKIRGIIRR